MAASQCLLWLLLLVPCCLSRIQLHYGLFTAGGSGGFSSSCVEPAIQLAEDTINNNLTLLSNYSLSHTGVMDTQCDRAKSLELFLSAVCPSSSTVSTVPTIMGVIGCGCSIASAPVAEIISHFNIPQVSYFSTFSEARDRSRFSNFFRTIPSDDGFGPAIVLLLQFFGWQRIGVFTQQNGVFNEAVRSFSRDFKRANITLKNRKLSSDRTKLQLIMNSSNFFFQEEDFRVFFLNVNSDVARDILCQAVLRGLSLTRYTWILYGWYQDGWWKGAGSECTDQELTMIVEGALSLQLFPPPAHLDTVTDTGLTPRQFQTLYQEKLQRDSSGFTFSASLVHDALWTLALALHRVSELVASVGEVEVSMVTGCRETGYLVPLENFTHSNDQMGCLLRWAVQQTNFVGVSGIVQFGESGSRQQSEIRLLQYRSHDNDTTALQLTLIATTTDSGQDNLANFSYANNKSTVSLFPEGVSSDGSAYTEERTFYLALVVVYYTLASMGLMSCILCLTFNYLQRKKKVMRLTSPGLNYIFLTGISVFYLSVFFRIMPSTQYTVNAVRCSINIILTNLGYCLAFGTLLAKMGRVYYIFHNPTTNKKVLRDWHLGLVVLCITGIGCGLGVLHVAVPQLRIDAVLTEDPGYGVGQDVCSHLLSWVHNTTQRWNRTSYAARPCIRNVDGVQVVYVTYQCVKTEGGYGDIWLLLTYIYFGLLQLIGIILAIQTRKVHIKLLNDSKFVAVLIYISSILLLLLGIIVYLFNSYLNATEIVFSGAYLLAATLFAGLGFVPKMVSLYQDPTGEKIFESGSGRGTSMPTGMLPGTRSMRVACVSSTIDSPGVSNGLCVAQLQLKVKELEILLREQQLNLSQSDNRLSNSGSDLVYSTTLPNYNAGLIKTL